MSISRNLSMVFCAVLIAVSCGACHKEGPAERAGKSIDQTLEKAGDKIDNAADKTGEKIEEAGQKIKESVK